MLLAKAKQLVAHIFAHPLVLEMAKKGDQLSAHQTDHGMKHFLDVVGVARKLAAMLNERAAGTLSEWETEVVIPLAALFHDIGRAIDVENHDKAGAKWTRDFLLKTGLPSDEQTLPRETINRICKIIACHRSRIVLKRKFDDPCWAVVVLADKFVGDEERVRPDRALILTLLTFFGLSHIKLRPDGVHDQVNFAIKEVAPSIKGEELVLSQILDPRVCRARLILDTYADRYLACDLAARYLGLNFVLETVSRPRYGLLARIKALVGLASEDLVERYVWEPGKESWILSSG